jgi:probable F420-dependent oxidoreductase
VKLGLFGINLGRTAFDGGHLVEIAKRAEAFGWESVWTGEHFVLPDPRSSSSPSPPDTPFLEPFMALAAAAVGTERLLLGTGVTVVPLYRPLMLAKQVASLDNLSGGRFLFGVGAGHLEPEFRAFGIPLDGRGAVFDESLAAMRAIWEAPDAPASFHGATISFDGVRAVPAPKQRHGPPIVVGGYGPAAMRRAVQFGHAWYGYALEAAQVARFVEALDAAQERHTRPGHLPPLEISVTPVPGVETTASLLDEYEAAGVDRLILSPPAEAFVDPAAMYEYLDLVPSLR